MNCLYCGNTNVQVKGWTPTGRQRWQCLSCDRSFSIVPDLDLGGWRDFLKARKIRAKAPYDLRRLAPVAVGANYRLSELLLEYEQLYYPEGQSTVGLLSTSDVAEMHSSSRRAIGRKAQNIRRKNPSFGVKISNRLYFTEAEAVQLRPCVRYKEGEKPAG